MSSLLLEFLGANLLALCLRDTFFFLAVLNSWVPELTEEVVLCKHRHVARAWSSERTLYSETSKMWFFSSLLPQENGSLGMHFLLVSV